MPDLFSRSTHSRVYDHSTIELSVAARLVLKTETERASCRNCKVLDEIIDSSLD